MYWNWLDATILKKICIKIHTRMFSDEMMKHADKKTASAKNRQLILMDTIYAQGVIRGPCNSNL